MLEKEDIDIIYSKKNFLVSKLRNTHDADDVLQLFIEKFMRNDYNEKMKGRSVQEKDRYISMAISSQLHDFWRKQKTKLQVDLTNEFNDEPDIPYDESRINKLINLCERVLPEEQLIVVKKRFEGKNFMTIANEMNISINTALGRYRYAVINLRNHKGELIN